MSKIAKIGGINLFILIAYTLYIHFNALGTEKAMDQMASMAFVVSIHVFLNFIISIVNFARNKEKLGQAYLVSAGIVLIVGFSACLGGFKF